LKPYPPTLREKRRYLKIRFESNEKLSTKEVVKAFWNWASSTFGFLGAAYSSFALINFDEENQEALIRTNNEWVDFLIGSLGFFEKVNNKKVRIHIIRVSGTIKKTKKA